jgi:tetratricopeptide (TPR) repeat protein
VGVARRPQRRGIDGLSAPIVGRDEELAVLSAVAARVERDRVPQLVTLFGVAGVGKSRLLAELVDRLPGVRLLEGRCLPYGDGVTYWPLAQVAKEHAGILESDMAAVARRKLEAAVGSVVPAGETEAVVEAVGWTIGFAVPGSSSADLASGEVRAQLYGAWRRYVAALGRETPTVLAIDDLHWASEPLLDLLDDLADTLADTSVLIVCPARPELLETRPGWGARKQNAIALNLMPLLPSDARRLVAELLDEDRILDDVRARILERADGNPFYLEEILRMLIERGAIEQNDGGWIATGRPTDVPIPDSVHGVIAARVDLLDVPARDALRRCSAVGRIFWPAAVGVDDELVEALGRRGLVSEQPLSGIEGLREFAFKHALTRDVAYQSLPRHERRVLHRAIGAWVERVSGRTAEVAEIAAYHFGEAIRYGDDDPGTVRHAYELLHEAGEAAITRAAIPSAIGLFERAAALAPDERSRCAALIALGRCDVGELRYDRARTRLFEADEIARGLGDGPLHAEILSWVSRASWLGGFWDDAMAAAREAVAALDGLPESPTLSTALARLSQLEMLRGMPECEETAARAIEVGRRVGDSFAEINGLINVFTARGARGEPLERAEAFELLERATDERLWDEAYRVVVNYLWAASPYETIPDLRDVVAYGDERLSGLHGVEFSSFGQYFALSRARFLWIPSGQWDRVDDELRASGKIEAQGSNWLLVREIVAGMALRRGALHFVDELAPEWVERAISSCEPQRLVPMASVVLARAALGGDGALIHAITPHVIEIVTDGRQWAPFASPALPRSLYAAREHELLRALDECLTQRGEGERFARTTSAACSGLSALADGRAHDALPLLQEVTALEIERGAYYGAACAELDLALAYDALRETGPAADARERARAVLEPLGCVNPF